MLDPSNINDKGLPLTCRAVFIIGVLPTLSFPSSDSACMAGRGSADARPSLWPVHLSLHARYRMLKPDWQGPALLLRVISSLSLLRHAGPDKKLKLMLNYPASVGRNMDEILRVVDALQLSAKHSVATPANWPFKCTPPYAQLHSGALRAPT